MPSNTHRLVLFDFVGYLPAQNPCRLCVIFCFEGDSPIINSGSPSIHLGRVHACLDSRAVVAL